jgi:hypothetical protein
LARKLGYVNTFYHREPRLDITDISPEHESSLDFLISTDVFEHVAPPVSQAFINARRLLKGDGVFIFSVPYALHGETVEHFPDLFDYRIEERDSAPTLVNITRDGRSQEFRDLVFHGGAGETLEMRVFSEESLRREFMGAGFDEVKFYADHYFDYGIYWPFFSGVPIAARIQKPSVMEKSVKQQIPPFSIEAWGPGETRRNRGFNLQPNGCSALWLQGEDLHWIRSLKFGDVVLPRLTIAQSGKVLSVELAPHLLFQVGRYPVWAVTVSDAEYLVGHFHVRPDA